ncbi:hypothetical_protein [Leishmania infantum]|uniref:Hypothetical_protein n=1 Tax=Leishmania infantum TaxID=5671 RepID=A0A6L0XU50_LEIIN|nr:hypothetical_protein [Leishmania infantum]SUZ46624.1 hypothetical_protein [Leishmania infantum]
MNHKEEDDSVFAPIARPLSVVPLRYHQSRAHPAKCRLEVDPIYESSSLERDASPLLATELRQHLGDLPSASTRASRRRGSNAVHVSPLGSATVPAAAAAKKAENEAKVQPPTAEEESWSKWGYRHLYNSVVMIIISFYQIGQLGLKQQHADMMLERTKDAYMPVPPRAEDLKAEETAATASLA